MDQFDLMLLRDFVSGHWTEFQGFMEERGDDAEELMSRMEEAAGG